MLRLLSTLAVSLALTYIAVAQTSPAGEQSALEKDPKGWTDLTTLQPWVRVPIPKTAALSPENQWRFDPKAHVLICEGDKGHEMLRSKLEYKDFILHAEWRFKPVEGNPRYNSGVFVRASADGEHFTQGQVGPGPNVWLFADYMIDGQKKRVNLREQMTAQRVRPPGEWNTYELTAKGDEVSMWVNGATIGSLKPVGLAAGHVGLEAEGFYIEFRNVKIKVMR